jgi:hypothetical protein
MIPSKVPLSESFNDAVVPGKRYSFKQVIHQQRVLGRKVHPLNFGIFLFLPFFFPQVSSSMNVQGKSLLI